MIMSIARRLRSAVFFLLLLCAAGEGGGGDDNVHGKADCVCNVHAEDEDDDDADDHDDVRHENVDAPG